MRKTSMYFKLALVSISIIHVSLITFKFVSPYLLNPGSRAERTMKVVGNVQYQYVITVLIIIGYLLVYYSLRSYYRD